MPLNVYISFVLKTRVVVGYDIFLVPDPSLIFRYGITAEETEKLCKECLCTTVTYFFHLGKKKKIFLSLLLTYGVCHINHWWRTCSGIHVMWVTRLFYIVSISQIHALPSYKAQIFYLAIAQFFQRRSVFCQVFSSETCKMLPTIQK